MPDVTSRTSFWVATALAHNRYLQLGNKVLGQIWTFGALAHTANANTLHLLHFSTAGWTTGVTTGKVYILTLHDSGTSLDFTYALSQVWQICLAESHIPVPRGRAPFGQHQDWRPLGRSPEVRDSRTSLVTLCMFRVKSDKFDRLTVQKYKTNYLHMLQISDLGRHLGPVSRKLQKLFGPGKPFFNLYLTRAGGYSQKNWGGGVRLASKNPYPICDQNLRYSPPYLWPDQKFKTPFMTWPLHQNPVSNLHYN